MGSVLVNLSQLENVYSIKFKLILKGERKMYINKINRQMFEDIINALGITYLKIKSIFDEKYFYVNIQMPLDDWVYGYLLSFGENVEVVSPKFVRDELYKKLQNSMKNYL